MFLNGEEVSEDLGRMEFIGQAVPDRDAGVRREALDNLLSKAAVFDAVVHPAQHAGSIRNGFLLADLAAGGIKIGRMHAQVRSRHFKGAAGPGAGLFKNQRHILSLAQAVGDAGLLFGLQVSGETEKIFNFSRTQVQQLQKTFLIQ